MIKARRANTLRYSPSHSCRGVPRLGGEATFEMSRVCIWNSKFTCILTPLPTIFRHVAEAPGDSQVSNCSRVQWTTELASGNLELPTVKGPTSAVMCLPPCPSMGHVTGRQAGKHSGNRHRTLEEAGCSEPTESMRSSASEHARVYSQHTQLKVEREYRDGLVTSCMTLDKTRVPGDCVASP